MNTSDPSDALAGMLGAALHCIQTVAESELAAIYDLRDGQLEPRSMVGPLASLVAGERRIAVDAALSRALDEGLPIGLPAPALLAEGAGASASHVCLLVPLRSGNECLGAMVLMGKAGTYDDASTVAAVTAAGHGLAVALAMARRLEGSPLGTSLLPLRKAERLHLLAALRYTQGKIYGRDGAARLLDLKPTTLQSKLKKHGINRLDAVDGSRGSEGEPAPDVPELVTPTNGRAVGSMSQATAPSAAE